MLCSQRVLFGLVMAAVIWPGIENRSLQAFDEAAPAKAKAPNPLCGASCLYLGFRALDVPIESYEEMIQRLGPAGEGGYSLGELATQAEKAGLKTLGVQTTPERLAARPGQFVCIAWVNKNHFVLMQDVDLEKRAAWVVDYPRSSDIPFDTLKLTWSGEALLISPQVLVSEAEIKVPGPSWFTWKNGGIAAATAGLLFAVVLFVRRRMAD